MNQNRLLTIICLFNHTEEKNDVLIWKFYSLWNLWFIITEIDKGSVLIEDTFVFQWMYLKGVLQNFFEVSIFFGTWYTFLTFRSSFPYLSLENTKTYWVSRDEFVEKVFGSKVSLAKKMKVVVFSWFYYYTFT